MLILEQERLYLGPQNKISGQLRNTFANPTPLGVLGFAVGLFPLSIEFSTYSFRLRLAIWFKGFVLTSCSGLAWIRRRFWHTNYYLQSVLRGWLPLDCRCRRMDPRKHVPVSRLFRIWRALLYFRFHFHPLVRRHSFQFWRRSI